MTAGEEETAKFMEMFVKAMTAFNDREKDRGDKRSNHQIFDRDFVKNMKEFNGDKEQYNGWAFKVRNNMRKNNRLFFDIINFIERKENDLRECAEEMNGMFSIEDGFYVRIGRRSFTKF